MTNIERRYDIGSDLIICDNGSSLIANWPNGSGTSSIGIRRPHVKPLGETLKAQFSLTGDYFYLKELCFSWMSWLGVKEWDSKEELLAQQMKGIMGNEYAQFQFQGRTYYRETMNFTFWKVKEEYECRVLNVHDDMVQDFLSLCANADREQASRFNEAIAFSGRTLAWIMERIGEWTPPSEIPIVTLKD